MFEIYLTFIVVDNLVKPLEVSFYACNVSMLILGFLYSYLVRLSDFKWVKLN